MFFFLFFFFLQIGVVASLDLNCVHILSTRHPKHLCVTGRMERARVLDKLQLDLAKFALVYTDLVIAIPDAARGNPVFALSFFAQDYPEMCASPEEWKAAFLSRLPVFEFPPLLGFDAAEVRFSDSNIEHTEMLFVLRSALGDAIRKGLLVADERKRIAYLSKAFLFDGYSLEGTGPFPPIAHLFAVEFEPAPDELPMEMSPQADTGEDWPPQSIYVRMETRYGYGQLQSWIQDTANPIGITFVIGPWTASHSARERFLAPLNLLLMKFADVISEASTPLLTSPLSTPENEKDKKMLERRRRRRLNSPSVSGGDDDDDDDDDKEDVDTKTIGECLALFGIGK